MAFTGGNVTAPGAGGTPVLVYQVPDGVPTNIVLSITGASAYLLESAAQTPSTGYLLNGETIAVVGLLGSIYAISSSSGAQTVYYAASNIT